ncbi:MAG: hypothetical protein L0H59_05270 [Tomitella sp.]|nr:hypothetical protein [Tomitella sp.]
MTAAYSPAAGHRGDKHNENGTHTRIGEAAMITTADTIDRTEFIDDICDIAAGGGINYWATVTDRTPGSMTVRDRFEGDTAQINLATIAETITDLRNQTVHVNTELRDTILGAWEANSAAGIDAEIADVLVQLGEFGTITYG